MHVKSNHINIDVIHDKLMKIPTHYQPHSGSYSCQHQVFPEYIARGFPAVKAQHFDSGDLPQSFRYIDISQIIQHDKCEGTRAADNQKHYIIQALHHTAETHFHIGVYGNGSHAVTVHYSSGYTVDILFFLHIDISAFVFRCTPDLLRPGFRADIGIIIDIIFTDAGNLQLQCIHIVILQGNHISDTGPAFISQLFRKNHFALTRESDRYITCCMQIQKRRNILRFFGNHQSK